ncbi:MAG: sugar phosphate isomerase/epimerase family protein [Runella sp.]
MIPISRRHFLEVSTTALAGVVSHLPSWANAPQKPFSLELGVCTSYDKAPLLKSLGFAFIEEGVGRFLIPDKGGEAQYKKNVEMLEEVKLPVRSYVSFIPSNLKSVGPDANHEGILQRADLALQRAKRCGSSFIVFGSSGSRNIPDGFDRAKAKQQHIEVSQKMALLAEKHGITIAIEPLNRGETNFINSLAEGAEIVEAVNHPRFKLLCDIYHMLREDEGPEEIIKFRRHIVHCHIAEKQNRTPPGVMGDDFTPYFKALKKIKYRGGLSMECRWKNFDEEVKQGIEVVRKQLSSV